MSSVLEAVTFIDWLKTECDYCDVSPLSNGRYKAIRPFLFTYAIIVGTIGDRTSCDDRWCYHNYEAAKAAIDAWSGEGEPDGWHRHPATGRRRPNGNDTEQYVQF